MDFFSRDRPLIRESEEPSNLKHAKATATSIKLIYVATNRWVNLRLLDGGTATECNSVFPRSIADSVTFAKVAVSIPKKRISGDQAFDESGSALKNIYIAECEPIAASHFHQLMEQDRSKDILLFVHGAGNTFRDASQRMAQLAVDLDFKGPALLFSWPTGERSGLKSYEQSEAAERPSRPALKHLFTSVLKRPARQIHVIAHSIGSRLTINSLLEMVIEDATFRRFSSLILAAPDTDEQEFRAGAAQHIRWTAERVAIYCGDDDVALHISYHMHRKKPLGLCDAKTQPIVGVDLIRVNGRSGSITRHFYYADSTLVLKDFDRIIRGKIVPAPSEDQLRAHQIRVLNTDK